MYDAYDIIHALVDDILRSFERLFESVSTEFDFDKLE